MLIVKKENLPKIIVGNVEESEKAKIINQLLEKWGDDEGNLVIKNNEYDFWKQDSGYRYFDCVLNENEIEKNTEGTRYFGILDSNNKENKNGVGFIQLIKESEVINFVKEKIKENENDIYETNDEEIIQELEYEIEHIKKMIEENETSLENYKINLGDVACVIELYQNENEENMYIFEHDGHKYSLEVFKGDYFVKEI